MRERLNNYAFIDCQNLYLGVKSQGWQLDFTRFRVFLKDKYCITKAFLFIGYVSGNEDLYLRLQESGYVCVFRPTYQDSDGHTKGNCDAELVLHSMIEYSNYDKAVIVTGDGDFHCLIKYLREQKKLLQVLIPNEYRYSRLLKLLNLSNEKFFSFISRLQNKVEKRKGPLGTNPNGASQW